MNAAPAKFLVVDDHDSARQLIVRSLRALGYAEIEEAANGEAAEGAVRAAAASGQPFHLVLTDIHMPGIDGLELLRRCSQDPVIAGTKFVMITAEVELHCMTEALKLGALDYIRKPVNASSLKSKIESITRRMTANAA